MTVSHETIQTEGPDHAGVAFHPPVLLLLALLLGFGARWLTPLRLLPEEATVPWGPMVVAASLGWFIWAVVTMRRTGGSIPTSEPTEAIVVRGPYGWSRNPIYASMVALQVGVGIWANSGWFLGLAARFTVQASSKDKFTYYGNLGNNCVCFRGTSSVTAPEAAQTTATDNNHLSQVTVDPRAVEQHPARGRVYVPEKPVHP